MWFGSSVALDRLGRVGHGDHKSAPRRHAGRRSYLDDRAARRSYLDHLAGLDAGREGDSYLHVEGAPRARAVPRGRGKGYLTGAAGRSGPGASQRAVAFTQPLFNQGEWKGVQESPSALVWLVFWGPAAQEAKASVFTTLVKKI